MDPAAVTHSDRVRRFIFERHPVRGHWVGLTQAWRDLRAHTAYPPPVVTLVGEAVVAAVLLAATLKFRGTLTFQLQGNGAVQLLVAQCTHDFRVRAVARCEAAEVRRVCGADLAAPFRHLVGTEGRVAVTVEADEQSLRYQGVVPLGGSSLAESLEAYFAGSEQLPTRVRLAADEQRGAGLLVQKLPDAVDGESDELAAAWHEAERGVARLGAARLLSASAEELLAGGFPDRDLRLFRGAPVRFECRCSPNRVTGLLRALGAAEVHDILREQGSVTVTCEFCHRPYHFDAGDIDAVFPAESPAPRALH
jgi:molecular chaperone Hsp33